MTPETFSNQLQMCYYVVKANVGEVTHEESLMLPEPAGNCLNWILGHLVATRSNLIRGLGGEPVWGDRQCARYERHGPPLERPAEAEPLQEIWKAYEESQRRIRELVSELTPAELAKKAPFSPANRADETIGSLLGSFAFHDAYHTGQTGVLRRLIGKPPADL